MKFCINFLLLFISENFFFEFFKCLEYVGEIHGNNFNCYLIFKQIYEDDFLFGLKSTWIFKNFDVTSIEVIYTSFLGTNYSTETNESPVTI